MTRRWQIVTFLALASATSVVLAQDPGGAEAVIVPLLTQLIFATGISPGKILGGGCFVLVFSWASLYFAARLAGLPASISRTVLIIFITILLSIPLAFGAFFLVALVGPGSMVSFVVQILSIGAQVLAVKWIYSTQWARAVLTVLLASLLTVLATILLVVILA